MFLEALQLLAILTEPVIRHTFPHIPADTLHKLYETAGGKDQKKAMVGTTSMLLQAVVHYSPLLSLREIYSRLTHQLLYGSILRLEETGEETVPGWPAMATSIREGCLSPKAVRWHRPAVFYLKTTLPPPNKPLWKSGSKERRK